MSLAYAVELVKKIRDGLVINNVEESIQERWRKVPHQIIEHLQQRGEIQEEQRSDAKLVQ